MAFFNYSYSSRKYFSVWVLILVNLIPAAGVVFMKWDVFDVIFIYVLETVIIGLLNMLRMAFCTTLEEKVKGRMPSSSQSVNWLKLFLIPFFSLHYFFFVGVQLVFVFVLLKKSNDFEEIFSLVWDFCMINPQTRLALGGLLISHCFSFLINYIGNGEYARMGLARLMIQPYTRIFIQQIVVIAGAILVIVFNTSDVFVLLLVFLKIIVDVRMHLKAHQNPV